MIIILQKNLGFHSSMLLISIITAIFLTFISLRRISNLPNFYSYILGADIWIGILILFNAPWFINKEWETIGCLILAIISFTIFFFILSIPNHTELYFKDKNFLHPSSAYWLSLLITSLVITFLILFIPNGKYIIALFKDTASQIMF